jgi:hypothetical protein
MEFKLADAMPLIVALPIGTCLIAGSLGKGRKATLSTILIVWAVLAVRFLFWSSLLRLLTKQQPT